MSEATWSQTVLSTIPIPTDPPVISGTRISLPHSWMAYGHVVGGVRDLSATMGGKRDTSFSSGGSLSIHTVGAQGEIAFHLWAYGCGFVPTCDTYKTAADIGRNIEVRTRADTGKRHPLELIVREDDPDGAEFVHVVLDTTVTTVGVFDIIGHITSAEAKSVPLKNHGGYRPAHFVPNSMLRDPMGLRA